MSALRMQHAEALRMHQQAAQAEQEEASISSLYLPLSQAEHDDDADPLYVPTPQLEQLDAAAPLYLPLAHDEQLVYPTPL